MSQNMYKTHTHTHTHLKKLSCKKKKKKTYKETKLQEKRKKNYMVTHARILPSVEWGYESP